MPRGVKSLLYHTPNMPRGVNIKPLHYCIPNMPRGVKSLFYNIHNVPRRVKRNLYFTIYPICLEV